MRLDSVAAKVPLGGTEGNVDEARHFEKGLHTLLLLVFALEVLVSVFARCCPGVLTGDSSFTSPSRENFLRR